MCALSADSIGTLVWCAANNRHYGMQWWIQDFPNGRAPTPMFFCGGQYVLWFCMSIPTNMFLNSILSSLNSKFFTSTNYCHIHWNWTGLVHDQRFSYRECRLHVHAQFKPCVPCDITTCSFCGQLPLYHYPVASIVSQTLVVLLNRVLNNRSVN